MIDDKELQEKIKQIAYADSERELGTNPANNEQARVAKLSRKDFGYILTVEALAQKKLNDPAWIDDVKKRINKGLSDIKFNDELYHSGRGILESHARESYKENRKMA